MAQPEQKVVAQTAVEQVRRGCDIAHAATGNRDRHFGKVLTADCHASAAWPQQPRQYHRQLVLAAAALAYHRGVLVERQSEADAVEDVDVALFDQRDVGDRYLAGQWFD